MIPSRRRGSALATARAGCYTPAVGIEERSEARRRRMLTHRAKDWDDAEAWDLEFWQRLTPQERLSALVAIRRDVEKVLAARDRGREG